MSNLPIALFNEAHQRAFGRTPDFGTPEKSGPDHCPTVSVMLEVDGVTMPVVGKGNNQKVARQDAVDQIVAMGQKTPLRTADSHRTEADVLLMKWFERT